MRQTKARTSLAYNEAKAIARMLRVSPQKLNLVAHLIRGRKLRLALADLHFSRASGRGRRQEVAWNRDRHAENNH